MCCGSRSNSLGLICGAALAFLGFSIGSVLGQTSPSVESVESVGTAGEEWARSNPTSSATAQTQPVVKDNAHPRVSADEREAIGLPVPTWASSARVQPAVNESLEAQKQIIRERPSLAWVQPDRPAGFEGTVYVNVYLHHELQGAFDSPENRAAIKQVQQRVLSHLTAAEFSLIFAFKNTAGLVGYVNEAGLGKLANHPDVVAIGLDDQPRPEDISRARRDPGPKPTPGEPITPKHVERTGRVETAIFDALNDSADGYVFVIVSINPDVPSDASYEQKTAAARQVQDRILSVLTAEEFRLRSRGPTGGVHGLADRAGIEKLNSHADVLAVDLSQRGSIQGSLKPRNR